MTRSRLKTGYFVVEGLNSFATVFYCFYMYFYMKQVHGFTDRSNLGLAAFSGFTYMLAAYWGGKFAHRQGHFTALKIGFSIMIGVLLVASRLHSAAGQIVAMGCFLVGMSLTWPTLEALVSEDESPSGLQHMLGRYNVVWAATGSLSYFAGGAMLERLGLQSIFLVPAGILVIELGLTFRLASLASRPRVAESAAAKSLEPLPELNPRPIARTRRFVRLAWLANPLAYLASNTLIAVMPGVAARLGLSTTMAGICCSIWFFARLGSFFGLWSWSGWHYRFGWLMGAYVALVGAFAAILLIPNLAVLVLAQLVFGCAAGLLYYSSLFYSMDTSEAKSEQGGIHEAAIGMGNGIGPALGAASLYLWPQHANAGAVAVTLLLILGGSALGLIWRRG